MAKALSQAPVTETPKALGPGCGGAQLVGAVILRLEPILLRAALRIALVVWGLCGWAFLVPQQHRLIGNAPQLSPILLSLNGAIIYLAVSAAGALGALALELFDRRDLPLFGTVFILTGLLAAEGAERLGTSRSAAVRDRER